MTFITLVSDGPKISSSVSSLVTTSLSTPRLSSRFCHHVLPHSFRRASQADLTHGNEKGTVSFKSAVNDLSQKANFLRLRFSSIVKMLASSIDLISAKWNRRRHSTAKVKAVAI